MFFKNILLAGIVWIILSPVLLSQDSIIQKGDSTGLYKMSDVVITATRTETPLIELANSITVIDSAEIVNSKKDNVMDLLRDEYGVNVVQQGGPGKLANVFMRGGGPDHTLVLLDGIEMNMLSDPGNTYDFSNLPTDNIKRIEILRGPQSTLYGSNAMAGVINIITKTGTGNNKYYVSAEGGTYNTYKFNTGINGTFNIFNYQLNLSRMKTNGFSSASSRYGNNEKDGASNVIGSFKTGLNLINGFKLNLFYQYTNGDADYDQHGGILGDDPTYIYKLEENSLRLETVYSNHSNTWKGKAGVSYIRNVRRYSYDSTFVNPSSSSSIYDGRKIKLDIQNTFNIVKPFSLTFGLEHERETSSSSYFLFNTNSISSSIFPSKHFTTQGVFIEGQSSILNRLFVNLGLRYDYHDKFKDATTYTIAPAFIIWETGTKLKATYGTGFKAPSLYNLFDPFTGNKNLSPEKSTGWDAGIEQFLFGNKLTIGATYFRNNFSNLFGFDENYRTINIDKSESYGIELYFNLKPLDELKIKSNYTYTKTNDLSDNSPDKNLPLLRRPVHKGVICLNYAFMGKFNANVDVTLMGKRDDKFFDGSQIRRVILDSYNLINIAVSYNMLRYLQLYAKINNVSDTYYEEVYGYATPGFSLYGGFALKFD
jgi:vitamin B12 transporter